MKTNIVWKRTTGRFGSSRIWGSADPTAPEREAQIGFLAMVSWLVTTFLPPLLLVLAHVWFGVPSPRAAAALLLISLPMSAIAFHGLTRGDG